MTAQKARIRLRRTALYAAAALILPGAALAAPFAVKVTDVQFPQATLYPGQDLTLSYNLVGPGANVSGGFTKLNIEFVKDGTVVKTKSLDPGTPGAIPGPNTVIIPAAELPASGAYTVRVSPVAGSVSGTGYIEVTNPSDPNLQFYGPRGVDVNRVPGSPAFGRIYVTEGTGGATKNRSVKDGVYVLNPDLTPAFPTPKATSADIGTMGPWTGSSHSPFRVYVAPTGDVYITDAADAHPYVIRGDADLNTLSPLFDMTGLTNNLYGLLSDSAGNQVYGDTTSIWMEGSGANRKYYLAIQELTPNCSIWRYDVPEGATPAPSPTNVVDTGYAYANWYVDFVRDSDGNFYVTNQMDNANPAVKYDANGLWVAALPATDPATAYSGISIDDAHNTILLASKDGRIIKTTKTFDTATPIITGLGADIRDVAMDADGWIYAADLSDGLLRVFAPPGNYTIAATTGTAPTTLTMAGSPLAGDVWPVGPNGLYTGPSGQKYGDGKVDINDAIYNLRVSAGLNTIP